MCIFQRKKDFTELPFAAFLFSDIFVYHSLSFAPSPPFQHSWLHDLVFLLFLMSPCLMFWDLSPQSAALDLAVTVYLLHLFPETSNFSSFTFLFCVQRCAGFSHFLKIFSLNSENPLSDHHFSFTLLASLSEDYVLVAFIFSSHTDSHLMPYTVIWLKPCYNRICLQNLQMI